MRVSHDRYANIEGYRGLVMLVTDKGANVDAAFIASYAAGHMYGLTPNPPICIHMGSAIRRGSAQSVGSGPRT